MIKSHHHWDDAREQMLFLSVDNYQERTVRA